MMGMYGFGLGATMLGGLTMLLVWGGLIALVVWAVRQLGGDSRPAADDSTAFLRRRLAAGEITQDQYEQARRALQS